MSERRTPDLFRDSSGDGKPLACERRTTSTVNPQEANSLASNTPNAFPHANNTSKKRVAPKPPLPVAYRTQRSPKLRPTRAAASRLALEEREDDEDIRPMMAPQRKDTKEAPLNPQPHASRELTRTFSFSDTSSENIPLPPSLSYQLTDPISNTTPGGCQKPSFSSSPLSSTPSVPHCQQFDSLSDDALSAGSNSIRSSTTGGTINTLELVLAKRYAMYYGGNPTAADRSAEEENLKKKVVASARNKDAPSPNLNVRMSASLYDVDRANKLLLDEKRRQAGGYRSADMEQYTAANATAFEDFKDEPDNDELDKDDGSLTDLSLSTAPPPPSLHLRDHYIRPGAYRMRQGEEGRHVDNDSMASSSLRTFSTMRTNLGLGIIEARLVDDESEHQKEFAAVESDSANQMGIDMLDIPTMATEIAGRDIKSGSFDEQNYEYITAKNYSQDDGEDCEYPSTLPLPELSYPSNGAMTFVGTSNCSPFAEAEPLDERCATRAIFQRKRICFVIFALSLIFFLLIFGAVFGATGFMFGGLSNESSDFVLSAAPSSAPTSQADLQLEYFVREALPNYTKESLRWTNSPQTKALQWLQNNTNLENYPLSRRLQRYALATFYFSTGGERRWIKDFGWLSDEDECTWFSAEESMSICQSNEVQVLSLGGNGLKGTIVPEISLLTSLERLHADQNILTGFLPTTIGGLTSLREVRLFDNYLSGSIPSEFSFLSNLKILNLENNVLSQHLPPSLGQLVELEEFFVGYNSLGGPIPKAIANLHKLSTLHLFSNQFSGSIPSEFASLIKLVQFECDRNLLSGTIPTEIGMLDKLQILNLGNNTLSGSIPSEVGLLTQLVRLDMFSNDLKGNLPTEIGLLTLLEEIFLEECNIEGRLPLELGLLEKLKTVWLQSNKFHGIIPSQIGAMKNIGHLDLSENELSGIIPTELGLLTKLEVINLSFNSIDGPIPSELGRLTDLTSLLLNDNAFTGPMPHEVCNLVDSFRLLQEMILVDCEMVQCECCSC